MSRTENESSSEKYSKVFVQQNESFAQQKNDVKKSLHVRI